MAAFPQLQQFVINLQRLGQAQVLETDLAKMCRQPVTDVVIRHLQAGQDPTDGTPWLPKKEGGGRPYANAASKLQSSLFGNTILLTIPAPEAFSQKGTHTKSGGQKLPVRRMVPDAGVTIPDDILEAINNTLTEYIVSAMGG